MQRIWPSIEVTLSFPGRLLSGRTGGHGTRFDSSRLDLFFGGEHSGRSLNGAGLPPHPSDPHDRVSGPLCSRVPDRRYDPQWQDLTGFFPAPMPPAARCSIPTGRAQRVSIDVPQPGLQVGSGDFGSLSHSRSLDCFLGRRLGYHDFGSGQAVLPQLKWDKRSARISYKSERRPTHAQENPDSLLGRREGDIPNCSGELHDRGKPAFRRLGILPQQLGSSPFVCP